MTENGTPPPDCFGELDIVFPKGENGLRETPATCLECLHKTECLRKVLEGGGGAKVREEFVDRAYASGRIQFLERWSRKKYLHRRIRKKAKDERQ
ncbi:MAG: hypothetical protein ABII68_10805 [Pseudomonadota bacterium]